jgi:hypothetical protein
MVGMVFAAWRGGRDIPFFDLIIFPLSCTFNVHSLVGTKFPSPEDFLCGGLLRRDKNTLPLKCLTRNVQQLIHSKEQNKASIFSGRHG